MTPPILTRTYQTLGWGMLAFNRAMKIAMVPFPFPFAQVLTDRARCSSATAF